MLETKDYSEIKQDIIKSYVDNYSEKDDNYLTNAWIGDLYPSIDVTVHNENMQEGYSVEDVLNKGNILVFENESDIINGSFFFDGDQWILVNKGV